MAGFSSVGNFFRNLRHGKISGILGDIKNIDNLSSADFSPGKIHNWFNTRIFGTRGAVSGPIGDSSFKIDRGWTPNSGLAHNTRSFITSRAGLGTAGALALGYGGYKVAGGIDRAAGYLHGGPGYGGYIGWGEGTHSERNALQGAKTNMNYQAQMMGLQALSSNQIAPQYSLSIAPMRQRKASAALRNSTQGLALGLHKGRHGGY